MDRVTVEAGGPTVTDTAGVKSPVWKYDKPGTPPIDYNIAGFIFQRPGDLVTGYRKREQSYIDLSTNFQTQMDNHNIRVGASLKTWEVRAYSFGGAGIENLNSFLNVFPSLQDSLNLKNDFARKTLRNAAVSGFGYDEFGEEVSSGVDDAKRPQFLSLYVNDKVEVHDIIVNLGLRIDKFDLVQWTLVSAAHPGFFEGREIVALVSLN